MLYADLSNLIRWGRDGIVEETPIHVYYAYLKST